MPSRRSDFTPLIDLLAAPGTGPARSQRPLYVDLLPPCNHACPAGENVQGWLEHARSGRWHEAWLTLTRDNPLPAVHGRVCYHPCEDRCNRGELDSAVSIHAVERYLGDRAAQEARGRGEDQVAHEHQGNRRTRAHGRGDGTRRRGPPAHAGRWPPWTARSGTCLR